MEALKILISGITYVMIHSNTTEIVFLPASSKRDSSSRLLSLPPELIFNICEQVFPDGNHRSRLWTSEYKKALTNISSLGQTCKTLYVFFQPYLYRFIHVHMATPSLDLSPTHPSKRFYKILKLVTFLPRKPMAPAVNDLQLLKALATNRSLGHLIKELEIKGFATQAVTLHHFEKLLEMRGLQVLTLRSIDKGQCLVEKIEPAHLTTLRLHYCDLGMPPLRSIVGAARSLQHFEFYEKWWTLFRPWRNSDPVTIPGLLEILKQHAESLETLGLSLELAPRHQLVRIVEISGLPRLKTLILNALCVGSLAPTVWTIGHVPEWVFSAVASMIEKMRFLDFVFVQYPPKKRRRLATPGKFCGGDTFFQDY
ncbi:hypothetical protein QBC38DRAFT_531754 [Podospora fimiseda]|uniref:F-box domain-containing protein n=1 Tax=Podospora fimiseda TaxID=252190 RepID=A0AAN7BKT7_9PEZI|nr:hypothetical protein QBC38DRAFT_531754 [Podospora fimiseda]